VKYTTIRVPLRLGFLRPFVRALDELDTEFFKGLTEATHILNDRISFSKDGSGEKLDQWLLEYKMRIWPNVQHTVRQLNQQFVSKFRSITDKKLRDRCRVIGVPLKDGRRSYGPPMLR